MFSINAGQVSEPGICDCCGNLYRSVTGDVDRDDDKCAVYFASLEPPHHGSDTVSVGLVLGLGNWRDYDTSDDAIRQRACVYIEISPHETGFGLRFEQFRYSRIQPGMMWGRKLPPSRAKTHRWRDDFFAVADFIIDNDPVVLSHLRGEQNFIATTH